MSEILAIYPGSFDPLTAGHLDLIERGAEIFDHLVVAVLTNLEKQPLFTARERVEMLQAVTASARNVSIDTFDGLLDYEYELQMALVNRRLAPELETVFMMPAESYSYLSSRLVKEIFQYGGSVKDMVPAEVEKRLREKFSRERLKV